MMNILKSVPALALAGALSLGAIGAADAASHDWQGHGGGGGRGGVHFNSHMGGGNFGHGHGHGRHFRGPVVEFFGDPFYSYDDGYYGYRYGNGCGYYRARYHDTGRRYWLNRYEQCLEG